VPADIAVHVVVGPTVDDLLIQIKGEGRVECADALQDGLLASAACHPAVVTLDLSELRSISCLAMGVLVAFHRGVVRAGGRVRLAGQLQLAVREALARADMFGLFETSTDAASAPSCQAPATSGIQAIA
jgi:anti-anti-sigma factor